MASIIRQTLARYDAAHTIERYIVRGTSFWGMVPCGVLLAIQMRENRPYIILTKRAEGMRHNEGDVALPGGKTDDKDGSAVVTALRETEEEIGLPRENVDIVTRMPPRLQQYEAANYLIFPVVGAILKPFELKPSSEVHSVFSLPLERFLTEDRHSLREYSTLGQKRHLHIFHDEVDDHSYNTYGLTASMVVDIAVAYFKKRPPFEVAPGLPYDTDKPFDYQVKYLERFKHWKKE